MITRTIHIGLDGDLLRAADRAAKRRQLSRSALVREALREYLKRIETTELKLLDRRGYEKPVTSTHDLSSWEKVSEWPNL